MIALRSTLVNYGALSIVQGANALVPLLIFPLVLLRIGAEPFAELVLTEAVSMLALTIALYSFDVDALKRVVTKTLPADSVSVSISFSEVLLTRLTLLLVVGLILTFGVSVLFGDEMAGLVALWMMVPAGVCLQSAWMFQGLERNIPLAMGALVGKLSAAVAVVVLVSEPGDTLYVPIFLGLGSLSAGIVPIGFLICTRRLRIRRVPLGRTIELLQDGKFIFFGNVSVMMYRDTNVLVMGVLGLPPVAVSSYAIAEKIIKSVQAVVRPLNQVFFPKALRGISAYFTPSWSALRALSRNVVIQVVIVLVMCVGGILVLSLPESQAFVAGKLEGLDEAFQIATLMLPAVVFGVINFMLGIVGLNHLGQQSYMFRILFLVGIFNIGLCAILASNFGARGAGLAFVISEAALTMLIVLKYANRESGVRAAT